MRKLIEKCKEQGIFEQHKDYIKEWLQYIDQQRFAEKLETQLFNEIKRYTETRDKKCRKRIIEIIWNTTGTEAWIRESKE